MTSSVLIGAAALAAACVVPATTSGAGAPAATSAALRAPAASPIRTTATRTQRTRLSANAVRIAFVDTGVAAVSTLADRLVPGADLVDSTGTTVDRNGHGTAMASIAGGVCTACAIVPVRALGDSGMGTTTLAAQGVRWAMAHGARVINLSLTSSGADDDLTSAIESAVAGGAVVVVAAGNSGSTDPAAEGYPGASTPDALTVASVDTSRQLYPWSNHGSWVQIAAPGVLHALSTRGQTISAVGTSGSAAYVSGTVGQLLTCNPTLTPAQVRSVLLATANPVATLGGGGLVNPQAALASAAAAGGCSA